MHNDGISSQQNMWLSRVFSIDIFFYCALQDKTHFLKFQKKFKELPKLHFKCIVEYGKFEDEANFY